MVIIGSHAAKHWFPDFHREPKDLDYLCRPQLMPERKEHRVEYLDIAPLHDYAKGEYLEPDLLYTLKISHIFWDFKWEKHIYDITWLKEHGCKLNEPLFWELYKYWNTQHTHNKRSNLSMTKREFFDNALKKYDHDYLHTLISPSPMYLRVLKDGCEVDVCEHKFNALPFNDKLELVREEVYVMAYERLADRNFKSAYSWMLKKFIMNHAPIWEALFIVQNHRLLYKPLFNYKKHLDYELSRN